LKYQIPATIYAIAGTVETGIAPWYDHLFLAVANYEGPVLTVELESQIEFHLDSPMARIAATETIVRWLRSQPDSVRREFCCDFMRRLPVSESDLQGRMLKWEQLRIMQECGVLIGSHTISHPVLSQLDCSSQVRELRESREILERGLRRPVLDFAFPFGQPRDCSGISDANLNSCGYRSAVTTSAGVNRSGVSRYALRRVSIGEQSRLPLFAYRLNSLFLHKENVSPSGSPSRTPLLQATADIPTETR
jgi:peptidoglycan/xylan/chitin deacetylase (PgdA/CDA1 family)